MYAKNKQNQIQHANEQEHMQNKKNMHKKRKILYNNTNHDHNKQDKCKHYKEKT